MVTGGVTVEDLSINPKDFLVIKYRENTPFIPRYNIISLIDITILH